MIVEPPTPDNIASKIHDAHNRWRRNSQHNPRAARLYLGVLESVALEEQCHRNEPYLVPNLDGKRRRRTWEGMLVFTVDADTHLEFGE